MSISISVCLGLALAHPTGNSRNMSAKADSQFGFVQIGLNGRGTDKMAKLGLDEQSNCDIDCKQVSISNETNLVYLFGFRWITVDMSTTHTLLTTFSVSATCWWCPGAAAGEVLRCDPIHGIRFFATTSMSAVAGALPSRPLDSMSPQKMGRCQSISTMAATG